MTRTSPEEALARLEAGQAALWAVFGRLSPQQLTRPNSIGGDWSAKDLLGHIAYWEELALESLAAWRDERRPPTEASDWPGTDAANARNQERTASQSVAEVRERAEAAHSRLLQAMRTMPAAEWQAPPFYPGARASTLGELLGRVLGGSRGLFEHAADHLPDLRAFAEATAD